MGSSVGRVSVNQEGSSSCGRMTVTSLSVEGGRWNTGRETFTTSGSCKGKCKQSSPYKLKS